MDKYARLEPIGQKQNNKFHYKYCHKETGKVVAAKKLQMQSTNEFGTQCLTLRKITLLNGIEHENVARLLDIICNKRLSHVQLMLEYADTDLRSLIRLDPVKATNRSFIRNTLEQILRGLHCYHSMDVAHGNLNPTNVLVDSTNLTVKLTDLDMEKTPYMAPELLNDPTVEISPPADMFSVGCIFAEMLTTKPLFDASTKNHELFSIFRLTTEPRGQNMTDSDDDHGTKSNLSSFTNKTERDRIARNLENIIPDLGPSGTDLLSRMLCSDPSRRITVEQALEHPYIKSGVTVKISSIFPVSKHILNSNQIEGENVNPIPFNPWKPLPLGISTCFNHESSIMPAEFLNAPNQRNRDFAIFVISKCYEAYAFDDPIIPFLAINYFDLFFSRNDIPIVLLTERLHNLELFIISCLSLSWKMRAKSVKTQKFMDLLPQLCHIVTSDEFLHMELLVLKGLEWKLRIVTPLCFVQFYQDKFRAIHHFSSRTINDIILHSFKCMSVRQFKPSEVTASAFVAASEKLHPKRFHRHKHDISPFLGKWENVMRCVEGVMIKVCKEIELEDLPNDEVGGLKWISKREHQEAFQKFMLIL